MAAMKLSNEGATLIKNFEGYEDTAYQCSAGVWTIGYGHTGGVKPGTTITRAEADEYFNRDTAKFVAAVNAANIPNLKQNQFDALVSLCYNIGEGAFKGSTLLKKAKANANDPTIRVAFMSWVYAGQKANKGLQTRREKEADYYFKS